MSFLDTPWLDQPQAAPEEPSQFERGLRSGITGAKGELHAIVGSGAESLGLEDAAREQYEASQAAQREAAAQAPTVGVHDVHDLRSGFDYVSGLAGQMLPMGAAAIGAGLVTRRPFLAGTAVMAPFEAGDIAQRQQETQAPGTPGEKFGHAVLGGLASGAAMSIAPGEAAGRIAGGIEKGGSMLGRIAETGAHGAIGTGAGEAIKEQASGQDFNPEAVKEAAIAGGVGGALVAVPGELGRFRDPFNRAGQDRVPALANDGLVVHPEKGEAPADTVARSDAAAQQATSEFAKDKPEFADVDLSKPEGRMKVGAAMYGEKIAKTASDFFDTMKKLAGKEESDGESPSVQRSADYSGVRKLIGEEIVPALERAHPNAPISDATIQRAGDAIRIFMDLAQQGKRPHDSPIAVGYMRELFGKEAEPLMDRMFKTFMPEQVEAKAAEKAAFYDSLTKLKGLAGQDAEMGNFLRSQLKNPKDARTGDIREAMKTLRSYTDGSLFNGVDANEAQYRHVDLRDALAREFKDPDAVLERFQQEHEQRVNEQHLPDVEGEAAEDEATGETVPPAADNLTTVTPELEKPRYYGSKDQGLILSHEAHKRIYGNADSQAKKLFERARNDNPDRSVSFVPSSDLFKERSAAIQKEIDRYGNDPDFADKVAALKEKQAQYSDERLKEVTKNRPQDYGVIAAEGMKQEGRYTHEQARSTRLDTSKYPRSPSKIETDVPGVTLDAVKLTNLGKANISYFDGESPYRRTARAFFEGLGGVLDHYGAKVGALKDDLVIGSLGKDKPITYGDIKDFSSMKDPNAGRTSIHDKAFEFDNFNDKDLKSLHDDVIAGNLPKWAKAREEGKGPVGANQKARDALLTRIEEEMDRRFEIKNEEKEGREEPTNANAKYEGSLDIDAAKELHSKGIADNPLSPDNVHRAADELGPKKMQVRPETRIEKSRRDAQAAREEQVARERAVALEGTKDKPLESINVQAKLRDENGRELVFNGPADKHPGNMSAADAAKDIYRRRDMLKQLMKCMKG